MNVKSIVCIIGFLVLTNITFSSNNSPYFRFTQKAKIEKFPNGVINWSEGYFLARAKGKLNLQRKNVPKEISQLEQNLIHTAKKNLLNIILATKVDSYNYVRDYFSKSNEFKVLFLGEIQKNIIILPPARLSSTQIEAVVKYPLYGPGSLTDLIYRLDDNMEPIPSTYADKTLEPKSYSSIIIDVRHPFQFRFEVSERIEQFPTKLRFPNSLKDKIWYAPQEKLLFYKGRMYIEERDLLLTLSKNLDYKDTIELLYKKSKASEAKINYSPSLFPTIYDSEGEVVYSKDMVDKKKRQIIQYAHYTRDSLLFYKIEKVGENPLYIIADKIKGENNTDIMISKDDAHKIFLDKKFIRNLKSGKIYLIVQ